MENLLPILFMLFVFFVGFSFFLKLVFGKAAVDHAKAKFSYDLIQTVFTLPFKMIGLVIRKFF